MMANRYVTYTPSQHQQKIEDHEYPVYLLYIDLRSSVGGGFQPQMARVMKKLATESGTASTAMQHWALMVDGYVSELARKPESETYADEGMQNNPTFKRPEAIAYETWERRRQVKEVGWTKYWYTRENQGQITAIGKTLPACHLFAALLSPARQLERSPGTCTRTMVSRTVASTL